MGLFFKGNGDDGTTTLRDRKRISKDQPIFNLIGTLDELSAQTGMAISYCQDITLSDDLKNIQTKLSELMGMIAANPTDQSDLDTKLDDMLSWIGQKINLYGKEQDKLKEFVFPGKNHLGAALDVCRTVTRRAEREAVKVSRLNAEFIPKTLPVLNRLSSLFFVMRLFAEN